MIRHPRCLELRNGRGKVWCPFGPFAGLASAQPKRILYVTHSAGYRHASIDTSVPVLQDLAQRTGQFEIVATDDVSLLNASSLATFDAVLFFTTGELPISDSQKSDLLQFVRSGKGFAGVHSATDTFYTWPEYGDLIGARFNGHPWVQPVRLDIEDPAHPAMAPVQPSFAIMDEIYQFRDFSRSRSRVRPSWSWATSARAWAIAFARSATRS